MPQFEPRKKAESSKNPDKKKENNNRKSFQNQNENESENSQQGGSRSRRNYNNRPQSHKINMQKYEKMISDIQNNFSDILMSDGTKDDCSICCKTCDIFGITECRHPVCIECTLRLRVLNTQKACPICRVESDISHLMFASNGLETCELLSKNFGHRDEDRYGLRFENRAVSERYEKYLSHVCKICKTADGDRLEFKTFTALRHHMANIHSLTYCQICTDNLQLFSRERKTYDRRSLQQHIQKGDEDDRSQKGHPTCLFCSERFFDNEGQYRHLRKEHYFCQFCESAGTMMNAFYNKHEELLAHYKAKHFICEHADCKGLGIAFASKREFELHQTQHTGKGVQLEFSYNDRQVVGRGRTRPREQAGLQSQPTERIAVIPMPVTAPPPQPPNTEIFVVPSAQSANIPFRFRNAYTHRSEDFPTLPGASSFPIAPQVVVPEAFPRLKKGIPPKTKTSGPPQKTAEEFPSLNGKTVNKLDDWGKHTGNFEIIDDDEQSGSVSRPYLSENGLQPDDEQSHSRSYLPESVLQPPKSKHLPKKKPPSKREVFFNSLSTKTPKENQGIIANSSWASKAKGQNAITGVMVPRQKLAMPDIIPERSSTSSTPYQPVEEVWEDVPYNRKLTYKERRELEKKKVEAKLMEEEAINEELQKKMLEEPDEDLEMQAILMNDIASSSGNTAECLEINSSSVKQKDSSKMSTKLSDKTSVQNSTKQQTENKKKKNKGPAKNAEKEPEFPTLEEANKSPAKSAKNIATTETENTEASGLSSWLFSSMSNALGSLSLSNILGAERSQSLASLETKPAQTKMENGKKKRNSNASPPELVPIQSTSAISYAAPPGFETFAPPPGL